MKDVGGRDAVTLITGGARGIGLDVAERLYARGVRVALLDRDGDLVRREADRLGDRALGLAADVTDRAQLDDAVARVVERFGRIDVALANAGIAPPAETFCLGDPAAFDRVIDVNQNGVVHTVRAVLPHLLDTRGYLLIVSSIYSFMNGVLSLPYAMSKAAVEQLGRGLRVELCSRGVDVGVAYFGFIDTQLVRDSFAQPAVAQARRAFPRFATAPVGVDRAGAAIAAGIERRAARVTAPAWVRVALPLRGLIALLDGRMARSPEIRAAVEAAERARPGRCGDDAP